MRYDCFTYSCSREGFAYHNKSVKRVWIKRPTLLAQAEYMHKFEKILIPKILMLAMQGSQSRGQIVNMSLVNIH